MSATDELRPWWERLPGRLRWELTNFADLGLTAHEEEGNTGAPRIRTVVELSNGRTVPILVGFPFEYPIKEPFVDVEPGLLGPPHEVGGRLCLFDNAPNQWNPDRSVAELIAGRVATLLESLLVAGELAPELEEQIPPVDYLQYATESGNVVLVPDPFWGELPNGFSDGTVALVGKGARRLLMYAEGFGFSENLMEASGCEENVALGRWVVLPGNRRGFHTPGEILNQARECCAGLFDPVSVGTLNVELPEWLAINFVGPGVQVGEERRRWGFIELSGAQTVPPEAVRGWEAQALRPGERQLRIPELLGLEMGKIALLGAGSLGSKVAIELAKAGCGSLVLVDNDVYDANNAVRHELAPIHAGEGKAAAMSEAVKLMNPFCRTEPLAIELGKSGQPPIEFLNAIQGAHLLVETTGARAVTRLCERYGKIAGVPLLSASLTRGSRGGDMVLLDAEHCFDCFLAAQRRGEIPAPQKGEQKTPIVPMGCSHPAFTGTGFDSSELASAVARMAIRATGLTSYPPLDHNWAVVNFVAEPHWRQGTFDADPCCGHLR
jgi:hypothetical protein